MKDYDSDSPCVVASDYTIHVWPDMCVANALITCKSQDNKVTSSPDSDSVASCMESWCMHAAQT